MYSLPNVAPTAIPTATDVAVIELPLESSVFVWVPDCLEFEFGEPGGVVVPDVIEIGFTAGVFEPDGGLLEPVLEWLGIVCVGREPVCGELDETGDAPGTEDGLVVPFCAVVSLVVEGDDPVPCDVLEPEAGIRDEALDTEAGIDMEALEPEAGVDMGALVPEADVDDEAALDGVVPVPDCVEEFGAGVVDDLEEPFVEDDDDAEIADVVWVAVDVVTVVDTVVLDVVVCMKHGIEILILL